MEKLKELRDKTGAGMVDCKKALEEAGGELEKAVEILRKKGIAKAAKRTDRETSEGVVKVATDEAGKHGYILQINSETDFVARNEKFQNFGNDILAIIKAEQPEDMDDLMKLTMADGHSVEENINTLSGVIGEKLALSVFGVISTAGTVAAYSHMGGKIGVLVALNKPGVKSLATDIAMQIAAANPKYISPADVPAEELAKEKEIYAEQLRKEGKPENIIEKIMEGKVNKYYEEVCLVKQEFIKDDSKKIQDILGDAKVEKFIVYSLSSGSRVCGA